MTKTLGDRFTGISDYFSKVPSPIELGVHTGKILSLRKTIYQLNTSPGCLADLLLHRILFTLSQTLFSNQFIGTRSLLIPYYCVSRHRVSPRKGFSDVLEPQCPVTEVHRF